MDPLVVQLCDELGLTYGKQADPASTGDLKSLLSAVRSQPAASPMQLAIDHREMLSSKTSSPNNAASKKEDGKSDRLFRYSAGGTRRLTHLILRFMSLQKLVAHIWLYNERAQDKSTETEVMKQQDTYTEVIKEQITDTSVNKQPIEDTSTPQPSSPSADGPLTRLKKRHPTIIECLVTAGCGPDLPLIFESVDDMSQHVRQMNWHNPKNQPIGTRCLSCSGKFQRVAYSDSQTYFVSTTEQLEVVRFRVLGKYAGWALMQEDGLCMYVIPSDGNGTKGRGYHAFLGEDLGFTMEPIAVSSNSIGPLFRLPDDILEYNNAKALTRLKAENPTDNHAHDDRGYVDLTDPADEDDREHLTGSERKVASSDRYPRRNRIELTKLDWTDDLHFAGPSPSKARLSKKSRDRDYRDYRQKVS
ncbi:uncharacterized protein KY384_005227 [Bacidia gigantensis]|uniref:uncharacterized protein n=1 Tax=Bacidia gigantensis TaxID=2732470 RepID=UPI001D054901|nr:uncharacterized protein KY384_005227 [Bacidia gigantensis]KAG8529746.1 hypothetical protein KY384_005227 [Bacidia gigantensis]